MINLSSQRKRDGGMREREGDSEGEVVKWPFCPPLR